MTTLELIQYYASLLIFQYITKPKAQATIEALVNGVVMPQTSVQEIDFEIAPTSGTFVLSYNGNNTVAINWNDSVSTIQSDLQAVSGLSLVTVTGSIASLSLIVTFTGVTPPALSLMVESNELMAGEESVGITITETDLTIPLAIQNAFNLIGSNPAQGVQLDVLGKYAGVTRYGNGLTGQPITLDDSDFLLLIQMAIIQNNNGSSLYDIDNLLYEFFQGEILVVDSTEMRLTYLISSVASSNLVQLFVTENLLPAPMGVAVIIIYAPIINAFFGFITYENPTQPPSTRPFNDYASYQTDWPWFSYGDTYNT